MMGKIEDYLEHCKAQKLIRKKVSRVKIKGAGSANEDDERCT